MGIYLNPGNEKFKEAASSEVYVDKTNLIQYTNSVVRTLQKYACVSRPRRFGKSMAANMLAAYYSRGCDSCELFQPFHISGDKNFRKYLNQYNVVFLNMQEFLSNAQNMDEMLQLIRKNVLWDVLDEYPDYRYFDNINLVRTLQDVYVKSGIPFIFIIDEWDCTFSI